MSTYYNYYLEYKDEEGWHQLKMRDGDKMIYWHTGSYGSNFVSNYEEEAIPFSEYSIDIQSKYRDAYEKSINSASLFSDFYPHYCKLNLEVMIEDYQNCIHEYAGIISKNDMLKVKRNHEYCPELISASDYNSLPDSMKENYVYFAWDSPWSEYVHIYDIIPIVLQLMKENNFNLSDIRLVYYYC